MSLVSRRIPSSIGLTDYLTCDTVTRSLPATRGSKMAEELPPNSMTLAQLEKLRDEIRIAFEHAHDDLARLETLIVIARRRMIALEEEEKRGEDPLRFRA